MRKAPEGMSKLTDEVKAIKVANTRLRYLAKKYGLDSEIYQKAISPFITKKFDAYRNESKGVLQLSTKLDRHYNNRDRALVFGYIKNIPTIAKTESHARESLGLSRDDWKQYTKQEKTETTKAVFEVESNITPLIESLYKLGASIDTDFSELHNGRMTYQEAYKFVNKAQRWIQTYNEYNRIMDELGKYDISIVKQEYQHLYAPTILEEDKMLELINEYRQKGVDKLGRRKQTPFD